MNKVVHCQRAVYDVYIGRPSKWANPYRIGVHGTREEVIQKYREMILGNEKLLAALPELRGKVLGCWCYPLACHGDVLVELIDVTIGIRFYRTEEEWLNAADQYGNSAVCPQCGGLIAVEHIDVFHEGKCSACGFVLDEPCDHHSSDRGMCQLLPEDNSTEN